MKNRDHQTLHHIKTYCEDIADAIQRFGADSAIFYADRDYMNSVSMSVMQIGELSTVLSDDFKERTKDEMQWGLMRSMRNLYAHEYRKWIRKPFGKPRPKTSPSS